MQKSKQQATHREPLDWSGSSFGLFMGLLSMVILIIALLLHFAFKGLKSFTSLGPWRSVIFHFIVSLKVLKLLIHCVLEVFKLYFIVSMTVFKLFIHFVLEGQLSLTAITNKAWSKDSVTELMCSSVCVLWRSVIFYSMGDSSILTGEGEKKNVFTLDWCSL